MRFFRPGEGWTRFRNPQPEPEGIELQEWGRPQRASASSSIQSFFKRHRHRGSRQVVQQAGVANIEAVVFFLTWVGKIGIVFSIAVFMLVFEFDNATVHIFHNYSTSEFASLSSIGTLITASTILFAVVKPAAAKVSNVIGRGQTLISASAFYIPGYVIMATSKSIHAYAGGMVLYATGQSIAGVMAAIIISDLTTPQWRAFALGLSYFPFLITPWISAVLVEDIIRRMGWRWGIGMYAFLVPGGMTVLVALLFMYESRARRAGLTQEITFSLPQFCSDIDLGGLLLFMAGFACLLLPMTLAGKLETGWNTPWVIGTIIVGAILLMLLPFYEKLLASNPFAPPSYLKQLTIVLSLSIIASDTIGFSATHTFMFAWATVSHGFSPKMATFYVYTNSVVQCIAGICAGAIMYKTRRYRNLIIFGGIVRLVGYAVMTRLRGQYNSVWELFSQQVIQGIGSGIIHTALMVPAQIVVPHADLAQVLALIHCFSFLGSGIGSAVAGAIYTNTFQARLWKGLGDSATPELVMDLFQSITGPLPAWDTPGRIAVNTAYSDVMRSMTFVAVGTSALVLAMCFFLPNLSLPRDRNVVVAEERPGERPQGNGAAAAN